MKNNAQNPRRSRAPRPRPSPPSGKVRSTNTPNMLAGSITTISMCTCTTIAASTAPTAIARIVGRARNQPAHQSQAVQKAGRSMVG